MCVHVLLTNYGWHARAFRARFPDAVGPDSDSRQMPAWHHVLADRSGITLINIGVGPSNAKTLTDHLAVLQHQVQGLVRGHRDGRRQHLVHHPVIAQEADARTRSPIS
jgi:hypothetical protein